MIEVKPRPKELHGMTHRIETGCGEMKVTVNSLDGEVFEVFLGTTRQGTCGEAQLEALARAITVGLRAGVPLEKYVKHFKGIQCNCPIFSEGNQITSCADAIAQVLSNFISKEE